MLIKRL